MACLDCLLGFFAGGNLEKEQACPLLLSHASVVLLAFVYEVSLVLLPYLNEAIHGNADTYAALQSSLGIFELIGNPVFARFGDVVSRRLAMILAHVGGALSYGLLAIAVTPFMLYLSALPKLLDHGIGTWPHRWS